MLATLKEVLAFAKEHNCAIGAFNTPTLETLDAVIEAAEELGVPVIISHAELHEPQAPLTKIGPVMVMRAKAASVPVAVHLDHGEHVDYIKKAIEIGFTSVMYDGSLSSVEDNIAVTKEATDYAHAHGVDVEAEIGALSRAAKTVLPTAPSTRPPSTRIPSLPSVSFRKPASMPSPRVSEQRMASIKRSRNWISNASRRSRP